MKVFQNRQDQHCARGALADSRSNKYFQVSLGKRRGAGNPLTPVLPNLRLNSSEIGYKCTYEFYHHPMKVFQNRHDEHCARGALADSMSNKYRKVNFYSALF